MTTPNPHEALAREKKATAIADALMRSVDVPLADREGVHALAALVEDFTHEQRRLWEREARVSLASDATWARVGEILCQRARHGLLRESAKALCVVAIFPGLYFVAALIGG